MDRRAMHDNWELQNFVPLVLQTINFATWGSGGFAPRRGFTPSTPFQNFRFGVLVAGMGVSAFQFYQMKLT